MLVLQSVREEKNKLDEEVVKLTQECKKLKEEIGELKFENHALMDSMNKIQRYVAGHVALCFLRVKNRVVFLFFKGLE